MGLQGFEVRSRSTQIIIETKADFFSLAKHGKFHRTVQTFKFWRDEETREIIGTLAKSTKKRLRTMSPSSKQAQAQTKIVGRSL